MYPLKIINERIVCIDIKKPQSMFTKLQKVPDFQYKK